jgi:hypothetical protein
MARALKWIVSILSEADGTGSSSRIAMMMVIFAVAFSLVFFVIVTHPHRFPDGNVILGLSALVTAAASIYGANAWKTKPSDAAPVVPAEDSPVKGVDDDPHGGTR